jgi:hypothetical protein
MVHHTLKGCPHISDADYMAKLKVNCKVSESGCWEWQRFIFPTTGYGAASYRGKQIKAHRLSYMLFKGPIPAGLYVLHSCDVRHCCNPDHLRLGTISDNKQDELQRGRNYEANRTHCPRGHAYAEHGTEWNCQPGWRRCRICARARQRIASGWSEVEAYSVDKIPSNARTPRRTFPGKRLSLRR